MARSLGVVAMLIAGGCATLEPPPLRESESDATLDPHVTPVSFEAEATPPAGRRGDPLLRPGRDRRTS